MTPIRLVFAIVLLASTVAEIATSQQGLPTGPREDPWIGSFTKRTRGGDETKNTITITKRADGYHLSRPYEAYVFTEVEKGVLADRPGGIGRIYFGSARFADGFQFRVLRADFCYEQFLLVDNWNDGPRR